MLVRSHNFDNFRRLWELCFFQVQLVSNKGSVLYKNRAVLEGENMSIIKPQQNEYALF